MIYLCPLAAYLYTFCTLIQIPFLNFKNEQITHNIVIYIVKVIQLGTVVIA